MQSFTIIVKVRPKQPLKFLFSSFLLHRFLLHGDFLYLHLLSKRSQPAMKFLLYTFLLCSDLFVLTSIRRFHTTFPNFCSADLLQTFLFRSELFALSSKKVSTTFPNICCTLICCTFFVVQWPFCTFTYLKGPHHLWNFCSFFFFFFWVLFLLCNNLLRLLIVLQRWRKKYLITMINLTKEYPILVSK